jgi:hypothetical protein
MKKLKNKINKQEETTVLITAPPIASSPFLIFIPLKQAIKEEVKVKTNIFIKPIFKSI